MLGFGPISQVPLSTLPDQPILVGLDAPNDFLRERTRITRSMQGSTKVGFSIGEVTRVTKD